jgi:hypothetical protein
VGRPRLRCTRKHVRRAPRAASLPPSALQAWPPPPAPPSPPPLRRTRCRYNFSGKLKLRFEADHGSIVKLERAECLVEYEVMEEKIVTEKVEDAGGWRPAGGRLPLGLGLAAASGAGSALRPGAGWLFMLGGVMAVWLPASGHRPGLLGGLLLLLLLLLLLPGPAWACLPGGRR